jgi:hypothetical protein
MTHPLAAQLAVFVAFMLRKKRSILIQRKKHA